MLFTNIQDDEAQDPQVFRYTTGLGFAVETTNRVLPVFDADEKTIFWRDLVPAQTAFNTLPAFKPPSLVNLDFCWQQQDFQVLHFGGHGQMPEPQPCESSPDMIWFGPDTSGVPVANFFNFDAYVLANVVSHQIQDSLPCFQTPVVKYVGHTPSRAPLMAGKTYLVLKDEEERTKAAAMGHTIHLELLNLSREHSDSIFSTVLRELKSFGRGIWRNCLNSVSSFGAWSNFGPRFTPSLALRAFFAVAASRIS